MKLNKNYQIWYNTNLKGYEIYAECDSLREAINKRKECAVKFPAADTLITAKPILPSLKRIKKVLVTITPNEKDVWYYWTDENIIHSFNEYPNAFIDWHRATISIKREE